MKNIIVVTGGAGFVGSNLISFFLNKTKFKIISIDNYSTGNKRNHIKNKRVKYINKHTSQISKTLKNYIKNIHSLFHFGEFSRIYQSFLKMDDCINSNSIGTHAVFNFCLSNNIKLSLKLGLDGVYIPSFNKKINYSGIYSLPKSFEIIGSAHNFSEISLKKKQKCNEVFLSPIFKVNKYKKYLNISKFNLLALNSKIDCIALGGINQKNYKKIKLLKSKGFASISWAKKNGLSLLRPF